MRIAIPISDGVLAQHFGHCEQFVLIDVNTATKAVLTSSQEAAPPHEPGLLPRLFRERGVGVVITGGMGARARALFQEAGIEVVTGAESRPFESVVQDYLAGNLATVANSCDH